MTLQFTKLEPWRTDIMQMKITIFNVQEDAKKITETLADRKPYRQRAG